MTNDVAEVRLSEFETIFKRVNKSICNGDYYHFDRNNNGYTHNKTAYAYAGWAAAQSEIARLRGALEYYASDNIYLSNWRIKSIVMEDKGYTAKQALNPAVASSKED